MRFLNEETWIVPITMNDQTEYVTVSETRKEDALSRVRNWAKTQDGDPNVGEPKKPIKRL